MHECVFEGVEDLDNLLRQRAGDIDYVTLVLRTPGSAPEEPLGRFDWKDGDLEQLPVAEDDWPWEPDGTYVREPIPEDFRFGTVVWCKERLRANTVGDAVARARVRLYAPKGTYLASTQLAIRRPYLEDDERALVGGAPPTSSALEAKVESVALALLADLQKLSHQAQRVVQEAVQGTSTGYARLSELQNKALARAARQFEAQELRFAELAKSVAEFKVLDGYVAANASSEDLRAERRHRLASSALDQLSNTLELVIAKETGVNPSVLKLGKAIESHPRLLKALDDPKVLKLLEDPETAEALAVMLEQAAQAPPEEEAPPPAPDPETPPDGGGSPPDDDLESANESTPDATDGVA